MDNWVELLFLTKFALFRKHHYIKKVQNIKNPNNKVLGKAAWLKKFKKNL